MSAPVFVRVGASTPLGLTSGVTVRAMAAGMARFRDTEVMGRDGEPIRASFYPELDANATREERILFFARRAVTECLEGLSTNGFGTVPVLVVLPEADRGAPLQAYDVVRQLERLTDPRELTLDWSRRPLQTGRAGFFQALDQARVMLTEQKARAVVVVGADSYCDRVSLERLEDENRALSAENPDGLIPGEGAGCVLLAEGITARSARIPALARLEGVALSRDDEPVHKRTGAHARGLSAVFRKLREGNTGGRTDAIFSCQTGEGVWGRELSIAYMRNAALMPEPKLVYLVAENLGDMGASGGPIQVGLFLHLQATAYRRKRKLERAVMFGAADGGDVG
ncbi:MAG TPA: hypothetical protein PK156_06635, partial [Polyangium sp.]|nr:hypothetical protein [Polyangium sp.]